MEINWFLDCGAPTAKENANINISLKAYIEFCHKVRNHISVYANLDVIEDAKKTYRNQIDMEKEGLSPLPVFHLGEPLSYLKRYVDKYEYIAFGGISKSKGSKADTLSTLDNYWKKYILDGNGVPRVKVHGFGVSDPVILRNFPWYSADASTWSIGSRFSRVLVPAQRNGIYVYDEPPVKIRIGKKQSDDETMSHLQQYLDFLNTVRNVKIRNEELKERGIRIYLRPESNMDLQIANNSGTGVMLSYSDLRKNNRLDFLKKMNHPQENSLRFYFAIFPSRPYGEMFDKLGVKNRLISQIYLRKLSDESIIHFLETGIPLDGKGKADNQP